MGRYKAHFSNAQNITLKGAFATLGVSVRGQPKYKGEEFEAFIKLLADQAEQQRGMKKIFILVGDRLNAFNDASTYYAEQGENERKVITPATFADWAKDLRKKAKKFYENAIAEGTQWLALEGKLLTSAFDQAKIDYAVIRYESICQTAAHVVKYLKRIDSKYKNDATFRKLIHEDAFSYYWRHNKTGLNKNVLEKNEDPNWSIPVGLAYSILAILEELAVTIQTSIENKTSFFIYPAKMFKSLGYLLNEEKKISSKLNMICLRAEIRYNKNHKEVEKDDDSPRNNSKTASSNSASSGSSDSALPERAITGIQAIVDSCIRVKENKSRFVDIAKLVRFVAAYTNENKIKTKAVIRVISDYFEELNIPEPENIMAQFIEAYASSSDSDSDKEKDREKNNDKQVKQTTSTSSEGPVASTASSKRAAKSKSHSMSIQGDKAELGASGEVKLEQAGHNKELLRGAGKKDSTKKHGLFSKSRLSFFNGGSSKGGNSSAAASSPAVLPQQPPIFHK